MVLINLYKILLSQPFYWCGKFALPFLFLFFFCTLYIAAHVITALPAEQLVRRSPKIKLNRALELPLNFSQRFSAVPSWTHQILPTKAVGFTFRVVNQLNWFNRLLIGLIGYLSAFPKQNWRIKSLHFVLVSKDCEHLGWFLHLLLHRK